MITLYFKKCFQSQNLGGWEYDVSVLKIILLITCTGKKKVFLILIQKTQPVTTDLHSQQLKTWSWLSYHRIALALACRLARFVHVSTQGRSCQSWVQAVSSKLNRLFAGLLQSVVYFTLTVISAGRSSLWKQISSPNHSLSHEGI